MLTDRLSVSFLVQLSFDEVKEGQTNLAPGRSVTRAIGSCGRLGTLGPGVKQVICCNICTASQLWSEQPTTLFSRIHYAARTPGFLNARRQLVYRVEKGALTSRVQVQNEGRRETWSDRPQAYARSSGSASRRAVSGARMRTNSPSRSTERRYSW